MQRIATFMHRRDLYSYFEVEHLQKTVAMASADPDNQRRQMHMADFFDVGPGMQDGSTVYPVEIFSAPGDDQLQPPLHSTAGLHQVRSGQEETLRQVCQAASPHVYEAILAADPHYQAWHSSLAGCLEPGILLDEVFYVP
jgi:L-rhamnose mutarotase